jgi:FtsH-binding integral membrane protein
MRLTGAIELGGGITTGLLGVALSLYVMKPAETASDYLGLFSVTTCAALFVAVGAYAHTISRNSWGRILLWAGGIVLIYTTASLLLKVPVGLYLRGWVGLFLVLPGMMAFVTVIASLFNRLPAQR